MDFKIKQKYFPSFSRISFKFLYISPKSYESLIVILIYVGVFPCWVFSQLPALPIRNSIIVIIRFNSPLPSYSPDRKTPFKYSLDLVTCVGMLQSSVYNNIYHRIVFSFYSINIIIYLAFLFTCLIYPPQLYCSVTLETCLLILWLKKPPEIPIFHQYLDNHSPSVARAHNL